MQPNYFLLRDNQEFGPYTIDELLLQRLTSTDLVWVQGRTNAWCHPSELEEFTVTYSINREKLKELDPQPQRNARRPNRTGRGEIERRAEEIRRNVLSQAILSGSRRLEIQEDESPTSFKIPDERINLVMHKKRIKPPNPQFLAICFMLIFMAAVWFGRDLWDNRSRFLDSVAKPFEDNSTVVIPEKKQSPVLQNSIGPITGNDSTSAKLIQGQDSLGVNSVVIRESTPLNNKPSIQKKINPGVSDSSAIKNEVSEVSNETTKTTELKKDTDALNLQDKNDLPEIIVADKSKADKENKEAGKEDTVSATKTEKKRGFFGRLFKKKKDE